MDRTEAIDREIMQALHERMGDHIHAYTFPPPVFVAMQGKFVAFDPDAAMPPAHFAWYWA